MKSIQKKSLMIGITLGLLPTLCWVFGEVISNRADARGPFRRLAAPMAYRANTAANTANTAVSSTNTAMSSAGNACPADNIKPEFPGSGAQWKNGFTREWIAAEKERHQIKPIADNKAIVTMTESQREGDTYGNYTAADVALWESETERLVVEGSMIFHSADLLGSTNGTSCDMCHPDAEGTHAETYPKYQVQLGRAALLRDMANWCLENPCRAESMSGDDYRMRALEAYMQAQRSGKPMKYGKH